MKSFTIACRRMAPASLLSTMERIAMNLAEKIEMTSLPAKRSMPMSAQAADRLLELLSTDDLFRTSFMRDRRAALVRAGFDAETICGFWSCEIGQLASKNVIAQARDEIRTMLMRGLNQTAPQLDAGVAQGCRVLR